MMSLQVGKTYTSRAGEVFKIIKQYDPVPIFPDFRKDHCFLSNKHTFHNPDGTLRGTDTQSPCDLLTDCEVYEFSNIADLTISEGHALSHAKNIRLTVDDVRFVDVFGKDV